MYGNNGEEVVWRIRVSIVQATMPNLTMVMMVTKKYVTYFMNYVIVFINLNRLQRERFQKL